MIGAGASTGSLHGYASRIRGTLRHGYTSGCGEEAEFRNDEKDKSSHDKTHGFNHLLTEEGNIPIPGVAFFMEFTYVLATNYTVKGGGSRCTRD